LNNARTRRVQLKVQACRPARKVGIDSFDDLVALVALFRPGPMNMLPDYIKRKHAGGPWSTTLRPRANPQNLWRYVCQEQVMKIAVLGGFSLAGRYLAQGHGKKDTRGLEKYREAFVKGAVKNNIPEKSGRDL
jgi:DNA polymerase-3 subunit alpha